MLQEWAQWIASMYRDQYALVLGGLLFVDTPRYALTKVLMCLQDMARDVWHWIRGTRTDPAYRYCPTVCVVIAGYNEAETIEATLESVWGSYPRLEIIVVDDGSEDEMAALARRFARQHPGVMVLSRKPRGGKSSAMNMGLQCTQAEVVITVDADSHLGHAAIWEIVQPLEDPRIGAVSATVLARNPFTTLVSWFQAYEYLTSIFVGRIFSARMRVLGIASGAFAAFRRDVIEQTKGWDVGPGEDADITIKVRKAGYQVAFTPYAEVFTNVPESWWSLFKQRLRWDRSLMRIKCRKFIDVADCRSPNFRLGTAVHFMDVWFFNILRMYGFWIYAIWMWMHPPKDLSNILISVYLAYVFFGLLQALTTLYYTNAPRRDALVCAVFPLAPLYQFFLRIVRTVAVTDEMVFRNSYRDNYVPQRVRDATWHW